MVGKAAGGGRVAGRAGCGHLSPKQQQYLNSFRFSPLTVGRTGLETRPADSGGALADEGPARDAPTTKDGGAFRLGRAQHLPMDQTPVAVGTRTYWVSDEEKLVLLAPEDRAQYLYIVGKTGWARSTLLRNPILQDL